MEVGVSEPILILHRNQTSEGLLLLGWGGGVTLDRHAGRGRTAFLGPGNPLASGQTPMPPLAVSGLFSKEVLVLQKPEKHECR